jgi:hypothetical protein
MSRVARIAFSAGVLALIAFAGGASLIVSRTRALTNLSTRTV